MSVGETHELGDAAVLGQGVRVRDDDVLPVCRGDARVDVRGEPELLLVLDHVHVGRKRAGPAAAAVRDDDELVDLRVQGGQRFP